MKRLMTSLLAIAAVVAMSATSVRANNTTHSLLGIDVSHFQGFITWSSVFGDGVRYATAKASEGTGTGDSDFAGNMSRGKAAGLQMGAYHFAHPESSCPSTQANWFWSHAGSQIIADGKSIYPTLDLEVFSGIACSEGSYTAWSNDWSTDVKAKTANFLHPVLYISACNCVHISTAITLSAWIACYNGENLYTGNPWSTCCADCRWGSTSCNNNTWTYWQVSSSGAISGISGNVDLDAYNGTLAELKSWQGI